MFTGLNIKSQIQLKWHRNRKFFGWMSYFTMKKIKSLSQKNDALSAFNSSTKKQADLLVGGQFGSKAFQATQGYIVRSCLRRKDA